MFAEAGHVSPHLLQILMFPMRAIQIVDEVCGVMNPAVGTNVTANIFRCVKSFPGAHDLSCTPTFYAVYLSLDTMSTEALLAISLLLISLSFVGKRR